MTVASRSGRAAGISVYRQKKPTSKKVRFIIKVR
jgi:hypothetical protein